MIMTKAKEATAEKTNGEVGPLTRQEAGTRERIVRTVRLRGLLPIMFDRYPGDNTTKLETWQKLYFGPNRTLVLPSANVVSFLSAQNTDSAPKLLLDSRTYKKFTLACKSYVTISAGQHLIPFTREGQPIRFDRFNKDEYDELSGVYIDHDTARLEKGIPNPKVRPVLPMPWELEFELILWPNDAIQEQQLLNVFTKGGIALGLGTHRPQYGKFEVIFWE
jgi:hypothetical protein